MSPPCEMPALSASRRSKPESGPLEGKLNRDSAACVPSRTAGLAAARSDAYLTVALAGEYEPSSILWKSYQRA